MSFKDCILQAVKDGRIRQKSADKAVKSYETELDALKSEGLNDFDAQAQASIKAIESSTRDAGKSKYHKLKDMTIAHDISQASLNSKLSPWEKGFALLEGNVGWSGKDFRSRYDSIMQQYHGYIAEAIDKYRPKYAGTYQPVKHMDSLVKEMAGESSGDASARELAKVMNEATQKIVRAANRAGANIAENPRWYMPQSHSSTKMKNKMSQWVNDHTTLLDWEATTRTDGSKVLPEDRITYLEEAYKTLSQDGANKADQNVTSSNISDRLSHQRRLYYADSSAWLSANKKYGSDNPFSQYISWMDRMAKDTALMEVYGSNPTAMKQYFNGKITKEASDIETSQSYINKVGTKSPTNKVKDHIVRSDEAWDAMMYGNMNSKENLLASVASTLRSIKGASVISGSSVFAMIGDTFNASRVAKLNNLSVAKNIKAYADVTRSKATRAQILRSKIVVDEMITRSSAMERVFGVNEGAKWAKYVNDVTMRATYMTGHTQNAKWSTRVSTYGEIADHADMEYSKVPFRKMLEERGITESDWDIYRSTEVYDKEGLGIIRPDDLRNRTDINSDKAIEVANKVQDAVNFISRQQIIESTYRSRSLFVSKTAGGTWSGEAARSMGQWTSFPVTITQSIMSQFKHETGAISKGGMLGTFVIGASLVGAVGLQLDQIANGKDPLDMTTPQFWTAAAMKGGATTSIGDYLYAFGGGHGGIESAISGPSAQFAGDLGELTVGNLLQLAQGKETNFGREMVKVGAQVVPGTRFYPIRMLFQRNIDDALLKMTDRNAHKNFRRQVSRARKDKNQEFYWKPGQSNPSRGPDLSKMFGDR